MQVEDALRLAVAMVRRGSWRGGLMPEPGDLVVEVTGMRRPVDPDAIGWLIYHGPAPYAEDGTGPTREVWDVVPFQRWENAEFVEVPDHVVDAAGLTGLCPTKYAEVVERR